MGAVLGVLSSEGSRIALADAYSTVFILFVAANLCEMRRGPIFELPHWRNDRLQKAAAVCVFDERIERHQSGSAACGWIST